ncbi:MAG: TSUP family transporter, partial [Gammaproteobacteria bacterium]|nr:TSUP family transporter [Gammaproteobacteria bacterium]
MVSRSLLLVGVAFLANAFAATAGGGVGLIQLPLLLFLGLPYPQALATHKVASVALGVGAGGRYRRSGLFNRSLVLLVLASGLPGVLLGALVVLAIPQALIRMVLGALTVGLGL